MDVSHFMAVIGKSGQIINDTFSQSEGTGFYFHYSCPIISNAVKMNAQHSVLNKIAQHNIMLALGMT